MALVDLLSNARISARAALKSPVIGETGRFCCDQPPPRTEARGELFGVLRVKDSRPLGTNFAFDRAEGVDETVLREIEGHDFELTHVSAKQTFETRIDPITQDSGAKNRDSAREDDRNEQEQVSVRPSGCKVDDRGE
ncbi:MAG TPA: hypothetical protein VK745_32820 [Polyangiaceae bacterium]|nr:hypothetical protein [Polyangiaceae bacterium]